jgi:hypothetical protein
MRALSLENVKNHRAAFEALTEKMRGVKRFAEYSIKIAVSLISLALVFAACQRPGPGGSGELHSISVSGPTRNTYTAGESIDLAGLVVTARYANNAAVPVSGDYTLTWNNSPLSDGSHAITAAAGTQTVAVSWEGKTANFDITIIAAAASLVVRSPDEWESARQTIQNGGTARPANGNTIP